ncbi:MAG: AAA family ATPase [Nocardioidaceae bacterium]
MTEAFETEQVTVPAMGLVVLVGVSGSGKSTFARDHFKPTEVVSSDFCRGLVADDENDQSATPDAFDVLQLHRRYPAAPRTADRRRRHQRSAGRPGLVGRSSRRATTCSSTPS